MSISASKEKPLVDLNYSAWKTYRACQLHYKFEYVDRLSTKREDLSEHMRYNFLYGNCMHQAMQAFYQGITWQGKVYDEKQFIDFVIANEWPEQTKEHFELRDRLLESSIPDAKDQIYAKRRLLISRFKQTLEEKSQVDGKKRCPLGKGRSLADLVEPNGKQIALAAKYVYTIAKRRFDEEKDEVGLGRGNRKTEEEFVEDLKKSTANFIKLVIDRELYGDIMFAERPVLVVAEGMRLKGKIDLFIGQHVDTEDNKPVYLYRLFDAKSSQTGDPDQLLYYYLMLNLKLGEVKTTLNWLLFRSAQIKTMTWSEDHVDRVFNELREARDEILRKISGKGEFEANPTPGNCMKCPHSAGCEPRKKAGVRYTEEEIEEILEQDDSVPFDPTTGMSYGN
jgi:hypothetical protein